MPEPKFIVYGLIDPRNGELRYVGQSVRGRKRIREHVQPSVVKARRNTHAGNWIISLLRENLRPEIEILETRPGHVELDEAEVFWIAYFRSIGCRLTNLAVGGGGAKGWRMTSEQRAAVSARFKGVPKSEEHRRKMSESRRGCRPSPESIARGAAKRRGRTQPLEHRRMQAERRGYRPFCDQYGRVYYSTCEASRVCGAPRHCIVRVLRGGQTSTKGYVFRFIEESHAHRPLP